MGEYWILADDTVVLSSLNWHRLLNEVCILAPPVNTPNELVERFEMPYGSNGNNMTHPGLVVWESAEHTQGAMNTWSFGTTAQGRRSGVKNAVSQIARRIASDPRLMDPENRNQEVRPDGTTTTPVGTSAVKLFGAMGSPFRNVFPKYTPEQETKVLEHLVEATRALVFAIVDSKATEEMPATIPAEDELKVATAAQTQRIKDFWFVARIGRARNWRRKCIVCGGDEDETLLCGCGHTETAMLVPCGHTMCAKPCFKSSSLVELQPKTITLPGGRVMRVGNQLSLTSEGGFACPKCGVICTRTFQAEDVWCVVDDPNFPQFNELITELLGMY
jgi:hypothetical protein